MHWYLEPWKKFATFSGRARRMEYWMFLLGNLIIAIVVGIIQGAAGLSYESGAGVLTNLFSLSLIVPSVAVGVRRMHDTDHSGWWIVVPIVNLVFALTAGTPGPNKYGPDPKATAQPA